MKNKAKRLLFVLPTAQIGGTRTSLLNLLANMDKEKYNIDVMFIRNKGALLKQFKERCKVLPQDKVLLAGRESVLTLLKSGKIISVVKSLVFIVKSKLTKESRYEIAYKKAAKNYDGKYDCVIAYQEKDASEFAGYIESPKKITWIHTDFSRTIKPKGEEWFSQVTNRFDKVVFVSDACMNEFKEKSHIDPSKMMRIYNTFDSARIIRKSKKLSVKKPNDKPVFVSVGRFCEQKSFDRVVDAAYRLKAEGYKFKWYVIGDGELFSQIESEVKEKGLTDCVRLTGRKPNPYPYYLIADAFVITSNVESHPMVANEAFILSVPVISTSFSSAKEVVTDGVNGILCENNSEGVYQAVKKVLDDPALLKGIKERLVDFEYDNQSIIKQVEEVIDEKPMTEVMV